MFTMPCNLEIHPQNVQTPPSYPPEGTSLVVAVRQSNGHDVDSDNFASPPSGGFAFTVTGIKL